MVLTLRMILGMYLSSFQTTGFIRASHATGKCIHAGTLLSNVQMDLIFSLPSPEARNRVKKKRPLGQMRPQETWDSPCRPTSPQIPTSPQET